MTGKHLGLALLFAAGLATTVGAAQSATQKTPPTKTAQTKSQTAAKNPTKITGCVERNQTTVDRSSVSPPGDPGLPMYKLTSVDPAVLRNVLDVSRTSGVTGTGGITGEPQQTPTGIWLRAEGKTDLAAHVGHKVEVTGSVVRETKKDEPPPTSATSADAAKRGVADMLPTFKVSDVRMVSDNCK